MLSYLISFTQLKAREGTEQSFFPPNGASCGVFCITSDAKHLIEEDIVRTR